MYFINIKVDKIFYLRLLLANIREIILYKNIRTIKVQIENIKNS